MKTDIQLQREILEALKFEFAVDPAQIGVAVHNGIVTLSGKVDRYEVKACAEKAARRVSGVKVLALDIQVGASALFNRTDTELAETVWKAYDDVPAVRDGFVSLKVEDGNLVLEGSVDTDAELEHIDYIASHLNCVRSVLNYVHVARQVTATDVLDRIHDILQHSPTGDVASIRVIVSNNQVSLEGEVRSYSEKQQAENAAWSVTGVRSVKNELVVDSDATESEAS